MTGLIILVAWIACGVIAYGAMLADFAGAHPTTSVRYRADCRIHAFILSVFGPITIFMVMLFGLMAAEKPFKYGFMWRIKK